MPKGRNIWYVGGEIKGEKYVILVDCSMFELNQGNKKCVLFNIGCINMLSDDWKY